MKPGYHRKNHAEAGVSTLIEYVMITTILLILFVVVLLSVNANFMQGPVGDAAIQCIYRYRKRGIDADR